MGSRRHARELALQVLYQLDVKGNCDTYDTLTLQVKPSYPETIHDYIHKLVDGVRKYRDEIDVIIEAYSENWSLNRMAIIDRNILRLAIFEILYCRDIPYKVAIDEAVELGKKFGTEESSAFINGILDRIAKEKPKAVNQ
ncbi:MAG: transcription antitermination factor NusB [Deltaproteobacteria bacterium]|nr:transcription antitermination factor NusB [Deltaproteobacteria bacterium]